MKLIYKIELVIACIGLIILGVFFLPFYPTLTGYVSGTNVTVFVQDLDLYIDGTQSYNLISAEENLPLSRLALYGEVIGNGRVEILLDNGKGEQYLVYENIIEEVQGGKSLITGKAISGITGSASTDENVVGQNIIEERKGAWLVIKPKKIMKYEFSELNEDQNIVEGIFYKNCIETCSIEKGKFDSYNYELVFRIEKGTAVKLNQLRYTLYE